MRRLIIQILVGSIREGRKSLPVAQWVGEWAALREEFQAELVDLADWSLPMLSFAKPPAMGLSDDATQRRWAAKIGAADGYIFVSPEYNHGSSAVLKNALDYLYAEWNRKPAAFVSFGNTGGARAVEQLRGVAIELRMAALGEAVLTSSTSATRSPTDASPATAGTKSSSPCSSTAWRGGGAR